MTLAEQPSVAQGANDRFRGLEKLARRLGRLSESLLPPTTAMHLLAHNEKWWGEAELRMLPFLVGRNDVAVDVGAAEGIYSYFLSRYARKCYAFEANPESAAAIRRRLPRVPVRACALSDRQGTVELRVPVIGGVRYSGWGTVQRTNTFSTLPSHAVSMVRVPSVTLDAMDLQHVGLIKIDVEGHELEVLAGAAETLGRSEPNLIIEAEDRHRPDALRLVCDLLEPFGYRGWFLDQAQLVPLDRRGGIILPSEDRSKPQVNNFVFISERRLRGDAALRAVLACVPPDQGRHATACQPSGVARPRARASRSTRRCHPDMIVA